MTRSVVRPAQLAGTLLLSLVACIPPQAARTAGCPICDPPADASDDERFMASTFNSENGLMESATATGKHADLLAINCSTQKIDRANLPIMPPAKTDLAKLTSQAKAAICANDRRRKLLADTYTGKTLNVGYLIIGGGFGAQNLLANTTAAVRSKALIVNLAQSGILAGSDDPGQAWNLVFTGNSPAADDPVLTSRMVQPALFKPADNAKPNASRESLAYTVAMNEFALGVPVVPCKASNIRKFGENGVTVDCTLVGDFGAGVVTINAERGAVATTGLGLPKPLKSCRADAGTAGCAILETDEAALARPATPNSLPWMFSEWDVFSNLRGEFGQTKVDFKDKTLVVIGAGNAAASAITDILNPDYLAKANRPAKIVIIGDVSRLDSADGFGPPVYTRARLAAKCAFENPAKTLEQRTATCVGGGYKAKVPSAAAGEVDYQLDYFGVEIGDNAKSLDLATAAGIGGRQTNKVTATRAQEATTGVKVEFTAISNPWRKGVTYREGDKVTNASKIYKATAAAGATAMEGGPVGTTADPIVDGGVTWSYLGAAAAPAPITGHYLLTAMSTDSALVGMFADPTVRMQPVACATSPCALPVDAKTHASVKAGLAAGYALVPHAPIGLVVAPAAAAWATGTAYTVGTRVKHAGKVYVYVQAGTSGAEGPTATGTAEIADGTARVKYLGAGAGDTLNFRIAGAAASNFPADLLIPGNTQAAAVADYQAKLRADYKDLPGSVNNVNTGALLYNGWLTKKFGQEMAAWHGAAGPLTNISNQTPYYEPTQGE